MSKTYTQVAKSFQIYFNGFEDSGYDTDQSFLQWKSKLDSKRGTEGDMYTRGNAMRNVQEDRWLKGQHHCTPVLYQSSGCPAAQM